MEALNTWGPLALTLLELLAVAAFALSGVIEAARRRMDVVGVCVVAFLAAFGGGTLRDILLDHRPFFWVREQYTLVGVFVLSLLALRFLRQRHFEITERAIQWPDALGLGLFCGSGVHQAHLAGMPPMVCIVMGVITAVFGGVLRDMVCNEIPATLRDHRPYALCAAAGTLVYLLLSLLAAPAWLAITACVVVASGLRVLAILRNWSLPAWKS